MNVPTEGSGHMSEIARKVEVYTDANGDYRVHVNKKQAVHRVAKPPTSRAVSQKGGRTARSAKVK